MQKKTDDAWRAPETAKRFIEEVSGAIPFEAEQLDIMMRLISDRNGTLSSFLDVGCGNGIVAEVVLNSYPKAEAVLLDFNDVMLDAAREKLSFYGQQVKLVKSDYGDEPMDKVLAEYVETFDVILSRFSIHHQTDERKKGVYEEIFSLLKPGGIFINIEHVAPASKAKKHVFEEYMIDHIYKYQAAKGGNKSRDEVADEFRRRHEKDTNILASAEAQCEWLREIGYTDVDCHFKVFEIAVFSGEKQKA